MPKTIDAYGVQMATELEMIFSKYMVNKNIAMNTKTAGERKKIVTDWLNSATLPDATADEMADEVKEGIVNLETVLV